MDIVKEVVVKSNVEEKGELQEVKVVGFYLSWSNMFGLMFQAGMCAIPVGIAVTYAYLYIIKFLGQF